MSSKISFKMVWAFLSASVFGIATIAATVTPDHQAYLPGEPIKVTFEGGPGGRTDWIGIYPENEIPDGTPPSIVWNYVDNTRNGGRGFREGFVTLPGLPTAGTWNVFFLINDSYTFIATNQITVLDEFSPIVRAAASAFAPNQAITIAFTNGPAHPKDWIGIYEFGQTPGPGTPATLSKFADETPAGNVGRSEGTVTFSTGLTQLGDYVAYLLNDDGYTILAGDRFLVENPISERPRVISIEPVNNATNAGPSEIFSAVIENGRAVISLTDVFLRLDDALVIHMMTTVSNQVRVGYAPTNVFEPGSVHRYSLEFADSTGGRQTNSVKFIVCPYVPLTLPLPIMLETFDGGGVEGGLPAGWVEVNYTEALDDSFDLNSLNSASYKTWTTISASRFEGPLVPYSTLDAPTLDYRRVLTSPKAVVVNGKVVKNLATGRLLFANSGYRRGTGQVMFITTPDYNLAGKTNVNLVFNALMEQNQDAIATVEYSVDGGANWLPIAYYLDGRDVKRTEFGTIDVAATFTTEQTDTAKYIDDVGVERGGTYGSYLSAPLELVKAAHIQVRRDDDAADGKRVEIFRVEAADNQQKVRFRLGYAGTDSWYFGVDDFGLYTIAPKEVPIGPVLAIQQEGGQLRLSWVGDGNLQIATTLASPDWIPLPIKSPAVLGTELTKGFFRVIP